jgi:hypothetical protein
MAQSFWLFGSRLNIIADRTTTKGQYDLIEGYFPPGTQTPLHCHTRYSEQLYVLEGEFTVWAGENKFVLSAGESFSISPCIAGKSIVIYYMTWEALSPSLFTFTSSGLTRIGPTTQLSIPLLNAFGIAFLRML